MTSKAKAIEALRELCKSSHCVSESLRLFLKPFEVTKRKNIIYDYINQPSIDDAIAVVENLPNEYGIKLFESKEYQYILTALRGLKEGK